MEFAIKNHEFLEYGEYGPNLYGTRYDSIQAIIDSGKTAVLDPSPQSLKLLRSSPGSPLLNFAAARSASCRLPIRPSLSGRAVRQRNFVHT